ncbi:hypothetical protein RSAG8_13579, partial [Rhizoctonia solani AG-8 WAC10335]
MSFLTLLPTESVVHILQLLPPVDIRSCKLVSRQLLATIQESPELQYLLELDYLGFTPPLNPLDTLSLGDKIRILQEKRFVATNGTLRGVSVRAAKLESIRPLNANIRYARGALAVGKTIEATRQLQLYQLASGNKRTEHSSFLLQDMSVEASDFRFDPDLDLLVLLERATYTDADLEMKFHLKSLGSGLPHPLASSPVLRSTFKSTATYNEAGFQIIGKLLAILCFDMFSPRMCVWDWTTGELITSTGVSGIDFAFISEDTFLVPASRSKGAGNDVIAWLWVFTNADVQLGGPARHVASLCLPPTTQGPCRSQCHFIATSLPPAPLVINGRATVTTPKRIYEIGPSSHYLCLHVRALNIVNIPGEMAKGMLFIPSSNIHQALNKITANQSQPPPHIPWEDWARGTSWINTRRLYRSSNCIFGHRAALLSFDREERGWRVFVYDLRANARGPTTNEHLNDSLKELRSDTYLNAVFMNPKVDVRGPGVVTSFLVSENEHLNEHTDSIPPQLAIDDERVITYDIRRLRVSPQLNVYDI